MKMLKNKEKKPKRILIVEDGKPMARALELKLTKIGFQVTAVANGLLALEVLEKEKFDLILSDLIMPVLDGFGLLTEMKNRGNKTPVCVTTDLSQIEDRERAKKLGAKEFFVKSDTTILALSDYVKKFLNT